VATHPKRLSSSQSLPWEPQWFTEINFWCYICVLCCSNTSG
jgi:hypothetical protein